MLGGEARLEFASAEINGAGWLLCGVEGHGS